MFHNMARSKTSLQAKEVRNKILYDVRLSLQSVLEMTNSYAEGKAKVTGVESEEQGLTARCREPGSNSNTF